MMLQPETMDRFLRRKGDEARGTGMMARVLLFAPPSMQGRRRIDLGPKSKEATQRYWSRLDALLDEGSTFGKAGSATCHIIRFDPQAARSWASFAEWVEAQTRPGAKYAFAADHASKLPENVARVAALLHRFEGYDGDISEQVFQAAVEICEHCSEIYVATIPQENELQQHAARLYEWLVGIARANNWNGIKKSYVRRYGPNALRDNAVLDEALGLLAQCGRVRLESVMGRRGTTIVWLCW
jgi:hypothetical protein